MKKRFSFKTLCLVLAIILCVSVMPVQKAQAAGTYSYYSYNAVSSARSLIPYYNSRFYLTKLSTTELADACTLYRAIKEFRTNVYFPYSISLYRLKQLMFYIYYDCPWLIQYNFEGYFNYNYWTSSGMVYQLTSIPYTMSRSQYSSCYSRTNSKMNNIVSRVKYKKQTDAMAYIYKYLCVNCTYQLYGTHVGDSYGALVQGSIKCVGFARTFKWFMDKLGYSNFIIRGENGSEGHVWNSVKVNGKYYDTDSTFGNSDCYTDCGNEVNAYGYLNVSSHLIRSNWCLESTCTRFSLPGTNSMAVSYNYLHSNLVKSGNSASALLTKKIKSASASRSKTVYIQIVSKTTYNAMVNYLKYKGWLESCLNKYYSGWKRYTCWWDGTARTIYIHID